MTKTEARTRVARGAAYLDQVRPGWHNRIDVGTLTLHDPCGCIIGQLCGTGKNFARGLTMIGMGWYVEGWQWVDPIAAAEHGFDLPGTGIPLPKEGYQPLQDAWIEAIADRRFAGAAPADAARPCLPKPSQVVGSAPDRSLSLPSAVPGQEP